MIRLAEGTRALVTGGTSGIGAGIARGLAEAGAAVTVTGLTEAEAETARETFAGLPVTAVPLDVADGEAVARLVGAQERLDILVNCAGTIRRQEEYEIETFMRVLDINLTGTMRACVAARPLLARQGGSIVNIASLWSIFGGPLVPAYTASKGGIAQLTKSLAVAWAAERIRVNALAPGWIATALTAGVQADPARSGTILERTPMRRWGTPEDVAGPALFLCSPLARFVTGTVLPVDGGYAVV